MRPDRNDMLSFADEERIRMALSAAAVTEECETPAHVEAALLAGLRRRNRRGTALRVAAAGAIAAAIWVGLILVRPQRPAIAPVVAEQPLPAAPVAEVPVVAEVQVMPDAALPRAAARQVRRPATPGRKRETERLIYIPVGTWQAYEPIERGSIVQVRLPKSSLPNYGIPVSADRWNESIPAEVVLGEDGSMRAIRFVSPVQ